MLTAGRGRCKSATSLSRGFTARRSLSDLANARSVIPRAGGAGLPAIAPRGTTPEVHADLVLTAEDLLATWRA